MAAIAEKLSLRDSEMERDLKGNKSENDLHINENQESIQKLEQNTAELRAEVTGLKLEQERDIELKFFGCQPRRKRLQGFFSTTLGLVEGRNAALCDLQVAELARLAPESAMQARQRGSADNQPGFVSKCHR